MIFRSLSSTLKTCMTDCCFILKPVVQRTKQDKRILLLLKQRGKMLLIWTLSAAVVMPFLFQVLSWLSADQICWLTCGKLLVHYHRKCDRRCPELLRGYCVIINIDQHFLLKLQQFVFLAGKHVPVPRFLFFPTCCWHPFKKNPSIRFKIWFVVYLCF